MAAGKTTVARALAARLGWRAEDIDELIEARERRTVADIFARSGEPYFRAVEREILRLLLPLRHIVVATGGGTFMDPENRAAINMDGLSVWLDVPFDDRARAAAGGRPASARRPTGADGAALSRCGRPPTRTPTCASTRGGAPAGRDRRAHHRRHLKRSELDDTVRYLILSDIHANLDALEAVLAARRWTPGTACSCSATWSATAREPNAVIDRVRALDPLAVIRGNHDKAPAASRTAATSTTWRAIAAQLDVRDADAREPRVPPRSAERARRRSTTAWRSATARRSTKTTTSSTPTTRCGRSRRRAGRSACSATRICRWSSDAPRRHFDGFVPEGDADTTCAAARTACATWSISARWASRATATRARRLRSTTPRPLIR